MLPRMKTSPMRGAVARHRPQRLGIGDHQAFLHRVAHALARLERGPLLHRQRVPLIVPLADHRRAVGLGQAVDVGDVRSRALHRASTAAGGAAPAVNMLHLWSNERRCSSSAR